MISGSARLPRIDGTASLRQTRKCRRQTAMKRRLNAGGASRRAFISISEIAAGELEEHVLEVRRTVQVAQVLAPAQGAEHGLDVRGVAEKRLADTLAARREAACLARPGIQARAVHLDHLRLDVARDQLA